MTYSFPNLESICCSMSSPNCYFLTCIQVFQEAGMVFWYFLFLKNFLHVVIHVVRGFSIVNEDIFLDYSCFFYDSTDVGNLISDSSTFSKSSLNIWKFSVHILLKPCLENFEDYFTSLRGKPGKSGSVFCGVTTAFSYVLLHTRLYLCPSSVCLRL